MPNCPECGLDVPVEGLCRECRESERRRSERPARPRSLRLLLAAFVVAAAFAGGIILGRGLPFGNSLEPATVEDNDGPALNERASGSPSTERRDAKDQDSVAESQGSDLVPAFDIAGR